MKNTIEKNPNYFKLIRLNILTINCRVFCLDNFTGPISMKPEF